MTRTSSENSLLSTPVWIDVGVFLLSIFLLVLTAGYPEMASTFPRLVLVMIMVVTTFDVYQMVRAERHGERHEAPAEELEAGQPKQLFRVFYMAVLMLVFFAFMTIFGFVLGTLLFMLLAGWTLGYKKVKSLVISSVLITLFVYLIFQVFMNAFLPEGLIFTFFGG